MFIRVIACLLLAVVGGCSNSGSGSEQSRGNLQGFDEPIASANGEFTFRWLAGPAGQQPVEVQVLEVTEVSTGLVVYRNDGRFRSRDVNVAAWASGPLALLAYSGDVGTVTIGPNDFGVWEALDSQGCLSVLQAEQLDDEVSSRLPAC